MLAALVTAVAASLTLAPATGVTVTDVTARSGLGGTVNDNYANICQGDLNGDGRPDLVLSRHLLAPTQVFFRKADGTYRLGQQLANRDPHGCAIFKDDLGRTHLLFAEGAEQGRLDNKTNADWLVNTSTGHATLQNGFLGASDPTGRGRVLLDVRVGGRPGLFVGNSTPGPSGGSVNHLYASVNGKLVEQSGPFTGTQNTFGATATDWDSDGTSEIAAFIGQGTRLWHRTGAGWVDDAAKWHIAPAHGGTFADVNGDGHDDLVTVSNTSLVVYLWGSGRLTRAWSMPLHAGRAVVVDDLDKNGTADIYAVTGDLEYDSNHNAPDVMLLGNGTGTGWKDVSAALPQVTTGGGGAVATLHGTGPVRLLVTNGADGNRHQLGPRQVLAVVPD